MTRRRRIPSPVVRSWALEDASSIAKLCDVVFPVPLAVLLAASAWLFARGQAGPWTPPLLLAFIIVNVALTHLGPKFGDLRGELLRNVVAAPMAGLIYATGEGMLADCWVPLFVVTMGQSLLLPVAMRRPWPGIAATGWVCCVLAASHMAVHGSADGAKMLAGPGLGTFVGGLMMSFASAKLGRVLLDGRQRAVIAESDRERAEVLRREAEAQRHRAAAAYERLAEAQQQLVEASRSAALAEVSSGVLHNVKNALTSVGVSATMVGQRLEQSRLSSLAKAVELLRSQDDLAGFFASDPRANTVVALLGTLVQKLEQDRDDLAHEAAGIVRRSEHVKEIIARQQTLARSAGAAEMTTAAALVDDALALTIDGLRRQGVEVCRRIDEVSFTVDRHAALQILINFLKNAGEAMRQTPGGVVALSATRADDGVIFAVTDQGEGIAPEHVERMFEHGFTTKADGHGFGLHHSVKMARAMGGDITCSSAGCGQGATFRLRLPVAPTQTGPARPMAWQAA